MIEKALRYIVGMKEPVIQDIKLEDGSVGTFSDKELHRIKPYIPTADPLKMHTLSSLVEYIKANIDTMAEKMIVEVASPTEVYLISQLNYLRGREKLVEVSANLPHFEFNHFADSESFLIGVQSKFIDGEDRSLVLKFAGTVEDGTVANYDDNGVTQKATIRTGIASKADAIIPNPVNLKPYRTFIEVEQPESKFVFRMRKGRADNVECALFEADGGAWMMEATQSIKEYLKEALEDRSQFTVIS